MKDTYIRALPQAAEHDYGLGIPVGSSDTSVPWTSLHIHVQVHVLICRAGHDDEGERDERPQFTKQSTNDWTTLRVKNGIAFRTTHGTRRRRRARDISFLNLASHSSGIKTRSDRNLASRSLASYSPGHMEQYDLPDFHQLLFSQG